MLFLNNNLKVPWVILEKKDYTRQYNNIIVSLCNHLKEAFTFTDIRLHSYWKPIKYSSVSQRFLSIHPKSNVPSLTPNFLSKPNYSWYNIFVFNARFTKFLQSQYKMLQKIKSAKLILSHYVNYVITGKTSMLIFTPLTNHIYAVLIYSKEWRKGVDEQKTVTFSIYRRA